MAVEIILIDTSILIEYFRKTEKSNSTLVKLFKQEYDFCISAITEYEIYSGATPSQSGFWEEVLKKTKVLPFDSLVVKESVNVNRNLKAQRKQIDLADLFIAATAIANDLPFATLNRKHFDRIGELKIVS